MSDDYESAYPQRALDQWVLSQSGRRIAAMHLGGIVIECRLKAQIFSYFPESRRQWGSTGCGIQRPRGLDAHDFTVLLQLLESHTSFSLNATDRSTITTLMDKVQRLNGCHFIDLRYSGVDPSNSEYQEWMDAYQELNQWLNKKFS